MGGREEGGGRVLDKCKWKDKQHTEKETFRKEKKKKKMKEEDEDRKKKEQKKKTTR